MLIRAYLPQIMTALFGGLFVALGILTFGNPTLFDRLFIIVLIFTGFLCRKDVNVLGIILILGFERLLEELLWYSTQDIWYSKITVYCILGIIFFKLRYDIMAKIAFCLFSLSVISEIYWYFSDYQKTPEIYWYNMIIVQSLIVRYLLFSRLELTEKITKKEGKSINLDWVIFQVTRIYIVLAMLNILEYLVRHLFNLHIVVVYSLYPYAMQIIATYTLWSVFYEANKLLKLRIIKA